MRSALPGTEANPGSRFAMASADTNFPASLGLATDGEGVTAASLALCCDATGLINTTDSAAATMICFNIMAFSFDTRMDASETIEEDQERQDSLHHARLAGVHATFSSTRGNLRST